MFRFPCPRRAAHPKVMSVSEVRTLRSGYRDRRCGVLRVGPDDEVTNPVDQIRRWPASRNTSGTVGNDPVATGFTAS